MDIIPSIHNLRLAIPNKGRLMEPTLDLLDQMGLEFDNRNRRLFSPCLNFDLDLLFLRTADIPRYVENGTVDIGITGLDIVEEEKAKVKIVNKLDFGKCNLSIAVPDKSGIKTTKQLHNKKISTSFPSITQNYLKKNNIKAKIIIVEGAVEVTPALGVADAIVDIVSTGESLRANNLTPLEIIFNSESVLIAKNNLSLVKQTILDHFVELVGAVISAKSQKYIMMNAHEKDLEKIKKIIPGLSSPTVLQLIEPGMIAVHSVINNNQLWSIIPQLRKAGASGILVIPIEKMVN